MLAPNDPAGALAAGLGAPMFALPLDAFRVLAGAVSFCYFARTLRETADFSSPDGLLDHRLVRRLFPPTRLGAFHPGLPAWAFRLAFALACAASAAVALGYHVRPAAALLFAVAVSTYRWNFPVMYVDDGIMHLALFWLLLLPVGRTLTLGGWLQHGRDALDAWSRVTVPGGAARCFLANLALAYFVAGAYKWTSPMWRGGSALPAILALPIARGRAFWRPAHRRPLRLVGLVTLALEPLFPALFVLPAHSAAKWATLVVVVGFHVGIVATLRVPFANAAMLGALPIVLHDEVMRAVHGGRTPALGAAGASGGVGAAEAVGVGVVACLTAMVLREAWVNGRHDRPPLWKTDASRFRRDPACAALWLVGIAQSYRLFDWIDRRNYHVRYDVVERAPGAPPRPVDPELLFPRTTRHVILQSYLHGSIWLQLDPAGLRALRQATLVRYARRYARRRPGFVGTVEVFAERQRLTPDNLDLRRGVRGALLRFTCAAGRAEVDFVSLDPERPVDMPQSPPPPVAAPDRALGVARRAGVPAHA